MKDRVTVHICTWPGHNEEYFQETVESFRDQGVEPLVTNDDRPIHDKWNEAMDRCETEYLCLPHSDDVYEKDYLREMVDYMDYRPGIAAAFCMDKFIDSRGNRMSGGTRLPIKERDTYDYRDIINGMVRHGNFLRCETVIYRMPKLGTLRFPPQDARFGTAADTAFWFDILNAHDIGILDKQLVRYRHWAGQTATESQRNTPGPIDHWKAMKHAMYLRPGALEWDTRIALAKAIAENEEKEEAKRVRERAERATTVEFYVCHEPVDNAGTGILVANWVRRRNRQDDDGIAYYIHPHAEGADVATGYAKGCPVIVCPHTGFQALVDKFQPSLIQFHHLLRWPLGILCVETSARREVFLHDSYLWCARWHSINDRLEVCNEPEPNKCERCAQTPAHQVAEQNKFLRETLPQMDRVVANSEYTATYARKYLGVPVEVEEPEIPALPIYRRRKKVGFFGGFYPVKGIHVLLEAWSRVKWGQLLLFCDVPDELRDGRSVHGYENVLVMGRYSRSDLGKIANLCDVVVVPSINESFGLVARELQLLGLPVVATKVGGMESVGTVDSNDVDALADALQGAIDA